MKDHSIEIETISSSWLVAASSNQSSREYAENSWAIELMMDLPDSNPAKAWCVIKAVYKNTENKNALSLLAAGPLEHLLYSNAENYLAEIQAESNNTTFIGLLKQVRLSSEDTPHYKQIYKIAGIEPPLED